MSKYIGSNGRMLNIIKYIGTETSLENRQATSLMIITSTYGKHTRIMSKVIKPGKRLQPVLMLKRGRSRIAKKYRFTDAATASEGGTAASKRKVSKYAINMIVILSAVR